jgi:hypothetical protein
MVFTHAVHAKLHTKSEERFITLGGTDLPAHPCSILWPAFAAAGPWEKGQTITLTAHCLYVSGRPLLALNTLPMFFPSRKQRPSADREDMIKALRASAEVADALEPRGGFHDLFLARKGQTDKKGLLAGAFAAFSTSMGKKISAALSELQNSGDTSALEKAARALAGSGQGLTPAGDDFLGGLFSALRYHGKSIGKELVPAPFLQSLAADLAGRSTDFSGFMLRCAAKGFIAAPLSLWLKAVHQGKPEEAASLLPEMARIGASSGLDAFCALLLAMQIVLGEHPWLHP